MLKRTKCLFVPLCEPGFAYYATGMFPEIFPIKLIWLVELLLVFGGGAQMFYAVLDIMICDAAPLSFRYVCLFSYRYLPSYRGLKLTMAGYWEGLAPCFTTRQQCLVPWCCPVLLHT